MPKPILFLLFFICIHFFAFAQAPVIEWQRSLGGTSRDNPYCIIPAKDGGFIAAGSTNSTDGDVTGIHLSGPGYANDDFWVVKLNNSGGIEWKRCYGGTSNETAYAIVQTTDGGYVIAGDTWSVDGDVTGNTNGISAWIVKIDQLGNMMWQKSFGGFGTVGARSIRQTTDGGYIVAGVADAEGGDIVSPRGLSDFWVIKLGTDGEKQWTKNYGGSRKDGATCVQQTADGGYIVSGTTTSSNGDVTGYTEVFDQGIQGIFYRPDAWIVKLKSDGTLDWQQTLGGTGWDVANSIVQANDGGYVFTGYSNTLNATGSIWNVKIDARGNLLWQKEYGGNRDLQRGYCVNKTIDGGYVFAAEAMPNPLGALNSSSCNNTGLQDAWFLKTDSGGELIWQQSFGGSGNDLRPYVHETADGGYIASVIAAEPDGDIMGERYYDFWILKLSHTQPEPTVNVTASSAQICPSSIITFTANTTFGGSAPVYQWMKNGQNAGTNNATFTTTGLKTNDTIYCRLTRSNCGVSTAQSVISNKLIISTTMADPATIALQVSSNSVCAGEVVTFWCHLTNVDLDPLYQWRVNGNVIPNVTGNTFSSSSLLNNDVVDCMVTGTNCSGPIVLTSNAITFSVGPAFPVGISYNIPPDVTCGVNRIDVTAAAHFMTNPLFQWKRNGAAFVSPGPAVSGYFEVTDILVCQVKGLNSCGLPDSVTSQPFPFKGRHDLLPLVTTTATDTAVCAGVRINFEATNESGTALETYTWLVNGSVAGTSRTFSSTTLTDKARVECIMTVPQCSPASTKDYSDPIFIKILPSVAPAIAVSPASVNICSDSLVTFFANATGEGNAPVFQWTINDLAAGSSLPTFRPTNLNNGDVVKCVLNTGMASCSGITNATSNAVPVSIKTAIYPTVAIVTYANPVCSGNAVTIRANAGATSGQQIFAWKSNGQIIGGDNAALLVSTPVNGQQVAVTLKADSSVCRAEAVSNTIQLTVLPTPNINFNPAVISIAAGQQAQLNATVTGAPASFIYTPPGRLVNPSVLSPTTMPLNEQIIFTLLVTDANGCIANKDIKVDVWRDLLMPNSFTPNGDGVNDVFRIPPGVQLQLKSFSIYDRWGNRIFTTSDAAKVWDGRLKGIPLATSTYAYTIEGTKNNEPVFLKGLVLLLR